METQTQTKLLNPYLDDLEANVPKYIAFHEEKFQSYGRNILRGVPEEYIDFRKERVDKFSWAIPSEEAIRKIVEYSPIIEIGAGLGYWASLVNQLGGEIRAYDAYTGGYQSYANKEKWFEVQPLNEIELYFAETLFLCWPPYDSPMAEECIGLKPWKNIIYIGEGHGGCTANDEFHEIIKEEYFETLRLQIPQWGGLHDSFMVYEKI